MTTELFMAKRTSGTLLRLNQCELEDTSGEEFDFFQGGR